jgi:1-acyl-sn-glycerol-3-phosphate acyltransferase
MRAFLYYLSFALFGGVALGLNLLCTLLLWLPARPGVQAFFQRVLRAHFRMWVWWLRLAGMMRVEWCGARPPAGAAVYVANHPTLVDITLLMPALPRAVTIYKPAIRRNPLLGSTARLAGYVPSDAGHDTLRFVAERVREGAVAVIFPEGTRTLGGLGMGAWRPGFALVARQALAPVRALAVRISAPITSRGVSVWRIPAVPVRYDVTYVGEFTPADGESTASFAARVESAVRAVFSAE